MATYSDDFNRANETPLNTSTWGQSGTGSFNLASNQVSHPTDGSDNEVYYVAATASGDQFSQGTITTVAGGETGVGVLCRHIGTSTRTFIRAVADSTTTTVRSFSNGADTLIGTRSQTFNNGDVLRLEVTGTSPNITVKVFRNGTQMGADFTGVTGPNTGKPGLCYSSTPGGLTTLDNWTGGDLGTTATPQLPIVNFAQVIV